MGYHKKVGDTVWGSFPSGNTFFHADGLESTFLSQMFGIRKRVAQTKNFLKFMSTMTERNFFVLMKKD